MEDLKKTPLYQEHTDLNGKMVDFGGWALPVQYSGILDEVEAVRKRVGLFDVSHMGEIMVRGEGALDWLNSMVTNDVTKLVDGQILYAPMCYPDGGVVDDLLIYRFSAQEFLLVVNASNTDKDWEWLVRQGEGVELENVSSETAQLAIQGPLAQQVVKKLTDKDLHEIKFFYFARDVRVAGVSCRSPAPAIPARTALSCTALLRMYARCGGNCWPPARKRACCPAGWGPGTPCALRLACPCTGTRSPRRSAPWKAGWASSSSLKRRITSAKTPSRPRKKVA